MGITEGMDYNQILATLEARRAVIDRAILALKALPSHQAEAQHKSAHSERMHKAWQLRRQRYGTQGRRSGLR